LKSTLSHEDTSIRGIEDPFEKQRDEDEVEDEEDRRLESV
jgi:hypothetical protein